MNNKSTLNAQEPEAIETAGLEQAPSDVQDQPAAQALAPQPAANHPAEPPSMPQVLADYLEATGRRDRVAFDQLVRSSASRQKQQQMHGAGQCHFYGTVQLTEAKSKPSQILQGGQPHDQRSGLGESFGNEAGQNPHMGLAQQSGLNLADHQRHADFMRKLHGGKASQLQVPNFFAQPLAQPCSQPLSRAHERSGESVMGPLRDSGPRQSQSRPQSQTSGRLGAQSRGQARAQFQVRERNRVQGRPPNRSRGRPPAGNRPSRGTHSSGIRKIVYKTVVYFK